MRKLYLTHVRPLPIALVILIKTKNHGVLKTLTKSQFHHINLNLTNINSLTKWQVFISMKLNLNMNVTPNYYFVINSNFWIYIDFGIITQFGLISRVNIDSRTYRLWNWTTNFGKSHSIDGKRMWILIFWLGLNS